MVVQNISVAVSFGTATVNDFRGSIEVDAGTEFLVTLKNFDAPVKWFADNDAVLDIQVSKDSHSAIIKALQPGDSEIEIQYRRRFIVKTVKITVRGLNDSADHVDVNADKPQPK